MAGAEDTGIPRPTDAMVDVLIIGSGASGAAVAWGLAETRVKILCLEQGDWIKPTDFPTNGPDWEARRFPHQPESARARHRLSRQRLQLPDESCQLQWRRRRNDPLHGAFSAPASVRLPGQDA